MGFLVYLLPMYFSTECVAFLMCLLCHIWVIFSIRDRWAPSPNYIRLFLASSPPPPSTANSGPTRTAVAEGLGGFFVAIVDGFHSLPRFRHHLHNHLRLRSVDRINDRGHFKHPSHHLLDTLLEHPPLPTLILLPQPSHSVSDSSRYSTTSTLQHTFQTLSGNASSPPNIPTISEIYPGGFQHYR